MRMTFLRFEDPWLLLMLLLVPVLILRERTIASAINYSSLASLKLISQHCSKIKAIIPTVLTFVAIALFIIAFARPQEGRKRTEILSQGVDIVLAIDTSGSMQALDFKKKRNSSYEAFGGKRRSR